MREDKDEDEEEDNEEDEDKDKGNGTMGRMTAGKRTNEGGRTRKRDK